jgi:MFS superfamily sulfate permease-like transporter
VKPQRIKFDRNEFAGAMGDLGIFIPLVVGLTAITGVSPVNVLFTFGIFYIGTGLIFGFPLPVQPMKAIAVIAIAEQFDSAVIIGAGLFVGIFFLFSTITGLLDYLERITPKSVIRGIQLGLGIRMTTLAVSYMFSNLSLTGVLEKIEIFTYLPLNWILTLVGIIIVLILFRNRRFPAALILLLFGVGMSLLNGFPINLLFEGIDINLPSITIPLFENVVVGAVLLAIPQIPLTIGNSIFATKSIFQILFPNRKPVSTKKISLSVGVMNVISAFLGGIPVCHGAGGLAGHYRFGARTGGALVIIGSVLAVLGILYGDAIMYIFNLIPLSILGVLLFFAGLELMLAINDVDFKRKNDVFIMLFVAALAIGVGRYGFVIALIGGVLLAYASRKKLFRLFESK